MKARDFVRQITTGPMDRREQMLMAQLIFHSLADRLYDAELADGRPLRRSDIMGFKEFLRELANAAEIAGSTEVSSPSESRPGLKVMRRI